MTATATESPRVKLVIFDLDGVLVDSRELHYEALNRALAEVDEKFIINREEHLAKYDGRPTTAKLNMLTAEKGLPTELHNEIWRLKQEKTFEVINDTYKFDNRLRSTLAALKERGLTLYCASNSIFKTLQLMLLRKGLLDYFDFILSCEDVLHPKPAPDVYIQCMLRSNLSPNEVMVVEDSHVGRKAALLSGAHLCPVEDPSQVTLDRLLMRIEHINTTQKIASNSSGSQAINVVIPMATSYGSYESTGFSYSGPLVEINGRPLVKLVVDNINCSGRYTFVAMQSDLEKHNLSFVLNAIVPGCTIKSSVTPTAGPTQSILLAKDEINNDSPLLIVNCHQFVEWNSDAFYQFCKTSDADGVVVTFTNSHPRYSYVSASKDGTVNAVAEKKTISSMASSGIYYWKKGSDFVRYAEEMVKKFPDSPQDCSVIMAYQQAISDGKVFKTFQSTYSWQFKYPKDLEAFYRARKMTMV